ncbi:hypothetical protein C7B19_25835 [Escherichia coli]|nr:hypothetical protein C7B19_25835 [Escherichia coli]
MYGDTTGVTVVAAGILSGSASHYQRSWISAKWLKLQMVEGKSRKEMFELYEIIPCIFYLIVIS